jgi:ferric-dicitrate binding protein FerR (iron transport regulator)
MRTRMPNEFRMAFRSLVGISLAIVLLASGAEEAGAQTRASGCRIEQAGSTAREVVRCGAGVTITAESLSEYTLIDTDSDGSPDAVTLQEKAILIEFSISGGDDGFEVRTPQAIAAVRGTTWAVDVNEGKTAVFVVDGSVSVTRRADSSEVTLSPGEGVDVDESLSPLVVRRWPPARSAALLARLGR